jgi:hypothetical protein
MAIDLKKMKQKLADLNNKGGSKTDFWSPKEGSSYTIRLLPDNEGDPFKSAWFHYKIGGKTILCPKKNFGEECAICAFASKLYSEKTPESTKAAKEFSAKQRFFSAVIVRGEEKDGVKIWGYGKMAHTDMIGLVVNPEYGDITDVENGTDLMISISKNAGQSFPTTKITPSRRTTPVLKEVSEVDALLESIPEFDSLHKRCSSADAQAALDAHLTGDSSDEEAEDLSSEKTLGSSVASAAPAKKGAAPAKKRSNDPVEDAFADLMDG